MTRFKLTFRRDGEPDQTEHRFNDKDGEPHIDGRLIVDGETYAIRGVEWLLRRDGGGDDSPTFICSSSWNPPRTDASPGARRRKREGLV